MLQESRPLAFVTHDIGGVVFKQVRRTTLRIEMVLVINIFSNCVHQAMIIASRNKRKYGSILRSTFGVVGKPLNFMSPQTYSNYYAS
jgi:hypothetical protein